MRLRQLYALVLLLASNVCHAGDFCSYSDANQLAWDKDFVKGVRTFFGDQKESYFWANGSLADQALAGIGGPPDTLQSMGEGLVLASACRAHSCDEKTAVVISCPSQIMSIGIIHFDCARSKPSPDCFKKPILTSYFSNGNKNRIGRSELECWAKEMVSGEKKPITYNYRSENNKVLRLTGPACGGLGS